MAELVKLLAIANEQKLRPDLNYFHFYGGDRLQVSNLLVWLDSESPLPVTDFSVPASEFSRAWEIIGKNGGGGGSNNLKVEKTPERLILSDKKYSIKVPTVEAEDFPRKAPADIAESFFFERSPLEVIKTALQFVDDSVTVPFASSIYFLDGVCYALNRAMLIAFDMRDYFTEGIKPLNFKIFMAGAQALQNIGLEILSVKPDENGLYVFLEDGSWLYAKAGEAEPPDFRQMLSGIDFTGIPKMPSEFTKAVMDLDQISLLSLDKKHLLYFSDAGIATAEGEFHAKAAVGSYKDACLSGALLRDICALADRFDFSSYPRVSFKNSDATVYGIVMGVAI